MSHYGKFLFFAFIYLIYRNKWVIVESTDTSATPPISDGDGTSGTPGQGASATPTPDGSTESGTKTGIELSLKATSSTDEFDYEEVDECVTFTAKDNYAFNVVKEDNKEIWKAEDKSEYATEVILNSKSKEDQAVTIYLLNGIIKVFRRNVNDNTWVECTQYIKLFRADPNDATKTKKLGTRDYKHEFDGEHVYEFNQGINCSLIKIKGNNVWQYDSSKANAKYPKGMGVMKETILIHFDDRYEVYVRDGDNYKITEFSKEKTVELDIKKSDITDKIDYNKFGNIVKFTGKGGHAFNVVKQDNTVIWKTDHVNEYAIKVVLSGEDQNDNIVTIYLLNGIIKVFRTDKNNTWVECTQYIKLFKADPNDANSNVQLDTRDYKYEFDGEHVYKFNSGVKCSLLRIKEKDVWKYDSSKHDGKYPKGMGVMKETIFIYFDGFFEVYVRDGDNYKITEFSKEKTVELDIKKSDITDKIDYNKFGNIVKFTGKGGHAFNVVKQNQNEIWRTDKEAEYSTKVVLNGKGKKNKIVTIFLLSGIKKVYKRDGKGKEWKVSVQAGTESVTKKPNKLNNDCNLVDLDIKKTTKTNFYDVKMTISSWCEVEDYEYYPKGTYLFKSVNHGSDVIWASDDVNKCSNKVSVHVSKSPSAINVWITLPSETIRFSKIGTFFSNGSWAETTHQAN